MWEREANINWSMGSAKAAPVRNYRLLALCRRLSAVNAIGTQLRDPINSGLDLGRNPISKHQIQPEYGDEQADAGRDG